MTDINKDCGHCITPEDRCSDESERNCMDRTLRCAYCNFLFKTLKAKNSHQEVCLAYDDKTPLDMEAYHEYLQNEERTLDERIKCERCDGHGTIANPAFDGMSVSSMQEENGYEETEEFLREYTKRGGIYDVICPSCKGAKVITERRRREFQEELEYQREVEAEQRMMGMGRY